MIKKPPLWKIHKDGIKSRVTTLIHRLLTQSASVSIWQYFCNITVASQRSLLFPSSSFPVKKCIIKRIYLTHSGCNISSGIWFLKVQCAACECIQYQFSMRLSSPGNSLYVPPIPTCFSHRCFLCTCFLHANYYKSCVWKCQRIFSTFPKRIKTQELQLNAIELQLWGFVVASEWIRTISFLPVGIIRYALSKCNMHIFTTA